jgi:zinc protease
VSGRYNFLVPSHSSSPISFRRALICAAIAAVAVAAPLAQAPSPAPAPLAPDAVIPLDRAVRTGTLENGLRFFIRQNVLPAKRIALRLAVKAGSLDESDDQQGLAHFVEHMAFNGSAHFKPGELISYFEASGARLGPHVNAYTSFEETVYMLELPTESSDVVDKGLLALADFAGALTFDPTQVDRERGVVVEEWRGGLGAGSRIRDQQIPALYGQSRYAERLPIGKPDILRSAPVARLRAFYDAFYRPERMAVVVLGDIDPVRIEAAIRAAFGPLTARAPATPRGDGAMPLVPGLSVRVVTDPELTQSSVQLIRKRPAESDRRVGDYRRAIVERLFQNMLNDRFGELARKPEATFLSAGGGGGSLSPSVSTFSLSARVVDGGLAAGLRALVVEGKRVRRFGFTAPELDRAKRSLGAFYERAYNERDKTESGSFAREYVSYFLSDEPSPGIEYEYRLVRQVLPGISLEEVSALARARLTDESQVLLATAPQGQTSPKPTEGELRAALGAGEGEDVAAWADETGARELMATKPVPGTLVSRRELPSLGVTILRLSNGVDVWLKPTDFKNDQVLFSMYALGGTSLAPPETFIDASLATSHIGLSGSGGLKASDVEKLLAGKLASASPFISLSTHGISGSASPAELETALQLLYLKVTSPGDDADAFALLKRQLASMVANRGRNPHEIFQERLEEINTSKHYTSAPLTPERVATIDRQQMTAFYRARFANAADFTLFVVGAFEVDAAIPLLTRYVASLPSTGARASTFTDLGIRFPATSERAVVERGQEPRSQTVISFFADPAPSAAEQEGLVAATTVLETSLRDMLREELGQTYTVSVGLSQDLPQRGGGHLTISFGAAPENIAGMADRVLAEVQRLQRDSPSADWTTRAKESARRGYETALKQNGYWLRRLESSHLLGLDPADILTRTARIDAVTPASLRETFRRYLPLDRYTVVTLLPARAQP